MRIDRFGPALAVFVTLITAFAWPLPYLPLVMLVAGLLWGCFGRLGLERWRAWSRTERAPIGVLAWIMLWALAWTLGWPGSMDQPSTWWLIVSVVLWAVATHRLWRWAHRSMIGERLEAGEGSAAHLNRILPAQMHARWVDAARRLGWSWSGEQWKPAPPLTSQRVIEAVRESQGKPSQATPYGVAIDLSETRPFWLRPSSILRGTPEWPGSGHVEARKFSGVWPAPKPARQIVYAASGHGKTVLLAQYLTRVALETRARVLYIDGKGSAGDADDLTMRFVGQGLGLLDGQIRRWSPNGGAAGEDPISLFSGLTIPERVESLQAMREAQVGDGKTNSFYEDTAVAGWAKAVELVDADEHTATGLAAIRDQLDGLDPYLSETVDKTGQTRGQVAAATLDNVTRGLFGSWASEQPFGWSPAPAQSGPHGGWDVGIISAPASSGAGRAMVAGVLSRLAVEVHRATNSRDARPLLIVVDECAAVFQSAQARTALEVLMAQGRSAGYIVTLCFQDPGQLDDLVSSDFRRGVETNSELVFLGRITDPARVLEIGGNRFGNEATRAGLGSSGSTSVRAQSGYGVAPMLIERMPMWAWAVYSGGQWSGVLVPPPHPDEGR